MSNTIGPATLAMIPSEAELAKQYEEARATARAAQDLMRVRRRLEAALSQKSAPGDDHEDTE